MEEGWSKEHLNHSVRGSLQAGHDKSGSDARKGSKESYGDARVGFEVPNG